MLSMSTLGRYVKIPNEVNPNVKILNVPNLFSGIYIKILNPEKRGKGTKLGEGERKVRLSQDRMPILGEGERD